MRGKQVSPPAPFRKGALGSRLEGTTHTAGMNPAYLVTSGQHDAGETGFPPSPLPQRCVGESLGRDNSYGRNESGLSSDVRSTRCGGNRFPPQPPSAKVRWGVAWKGQLIRPE